MSLDPDVSVIIPCFNQAKYLPHAIQSVLSQTHCPFEIVVVDDGSTDDSWAVATQFAEVRCVRQSNQGLASAP
jgi:glycosyltransferase involved in cell wall biosynthesis